MGHQLRGLGIIIGRRVAQGFRRRRDREVLRMMQRGEVSEWFKELVLKTSDSVRGRGFESHPLRHNADRIAQVARWRSTQEAEEDGLLNR